MSPKAPSIYPAPDDTIGHAELTLGGGMIMLGSINDNDYRRFIEAARGRPPHEPQKRRFVGAPGWRLAARRREAPH